jgi:hypothetical protein
VGGAVGAAVEGRLGRRTRLLAVASAAGVAQLAIRGAREPRLAANAVLAHPTAALMAGVAPIAAAPVFGRQFNAMHMLTITGVGLCAAVQPKRRYPSIVAVAAGLWVLQAAADYPRVREALRDETFSMTFVIVPLAFWAVGRITPDVLTAAREFAQLVDKLAAAEASEAKLAAYRHALEGAFPIVRDSLERSRRALDDMGEPHRREILSLLHRVSGRLDERAAVLDVGGHGRARTGNVARLLQRRAAVLSALEPGGPSITIDASGLRVTDPRTLALLGSSTAAGLSNAIRHGHGVTKIVVTAERDVDRLTITIDNDGSTASADVVPSFGSAGLGHLRDEARHLGGELTWGPLEHGGWRQRLEDLPIATSVAPRGDLVAEGMTDLIDGALEDATAACSWMVAAMALEGRQITAEHRLRTTLLTAATLGSYHLLNRRGTLQRVETPVLAAVAVVSAVSTHKVHSLWSGWANAALSRVGLRSTHRRLQLLTGTHVAAILVSYRGSVRQGIVMASHQIVTCLLGPLSIMFGAGRAIRFLDQKERALTESLLATEQLHEIAEAIHSAHPVTTPLERLEVIMREHDAAAADALRGAADALSNAISALPLETRPADFAEQFARIVAARVWPAAVELELNEARLDALGRQATVRMEFRRQALRSADRLGDALMAQFPADWLARPSLATVHLFITGDPRTRSFCVRVAPVGRVERPLTELHRFAEALSDVGDTLHEGFGDAQLRFSIPVS